MVYMTVDRLADWCYRLGTDRGENLPQHGDSTNPDLAQHPVHLWTSWPISLSDSEVGWSGMLQVLMKNLSHAGGITALQLNGCHFSHACPCISTHVYEESAAVPICG